MFDALVCIRNVDGVQGWVLSCPKLVLDGQWEKPGFYRSKLVNTGQYYILG